MYQRIKDISTILGYRFGLNKDTSTTLTSLNVFGWDSWSLYMHNTTVCNVNYVILNQPQPAAADYQSFGQL